MNIYCPKCNTCYSIDENLIPATGKKLRCQHCGEVWVYKLDTATSEDDSGENTSNPDSLQEVSLPEEAVTEPNLNTDSIAEAEIIPEEIPDNLPEEAPQNIAANGDEEAITTPAAESPKEGDVTDEEMNKIFSRLKDETDKISTEKSNQPKIKHGFQTIKKLLGWDSRLIISLEILAVLLLISLSSFAFRFELVRKFPQLEAIFGELGVEAKVIGEGLDFQNVTRNYVTENDEEKLNIKGFIINTTDSELEIPTVAVNILNNDAVLLTQTKHPLETKTIKPDEKVSFNIYTQTPPDEAKFVILTFIK